MKKLLLSLSLFCTVYGASAQILAQDNFSTGYVVGNIGTDLTGATTGQGGWLTVGAANSDFQIVDNGAPHSNVLQITGSATATGNKFMFTQDFATIWDFRDPGNDILSIEFDFFTGPATASKNTHRVCVFNADGTKILGGLLFNTDTKIIQGLSYYNNAGTFGNYLFNPAASAGGPLTLPTNTWVRMGFSFNKTTGQVICKTSGLTTNLNMAIPGAAATIDPTEVDIVCGAGTGNTASTIGLYDNYLVQASATEVLLAVDSVKAQAQFAVYPNPASNVINVSSKANAAIQLIVMTDLNGRTVKQASFDNLAKVELNITDLSAGVYMMSISSSEGTTTQKIIKQ